MTVRQFIQKHKEEGMGFYLIPNLLLNQKFSEPKHHFGHEVFYESQVNEEIIDKTIIKYGKENEKYIIIWKNIDFD